MNFPRKDPVAEAGRTLWRRGWFGATAILAYPASLKQAISGHNGYYIWGPGECTGEVVISVGVPSGDLETIFGEVEKVAMIRCEYCMPDEDDLPVYVCRDPRASLRDLWPQVKHYD